MILMFDVSTMLLVVDHGLHVHATSNLYVHALDQMVHMLQLISCHWMGGYVFRSLKLLS